MKLGNHNIRFIAPLDPVEGRRYVEPVKEEVVGRWDHAYNILEDYVHPTADRDMGWQRASSASSDSDDVLENWQNQIHEVPIYKCGWVTQSLH